MKRIILASASPRRMDIFKNHGVNIEVIPADIDEKLPEGINAADAVMFLALKKALFVKNKISEEFYLGEDNPIIVAADTVVFKDKILGKPNSEQEAFDMLSGLRNDSHFVVTGVAIIDVNGFFKKVFYDKSEVMFYDYSDTEIMDYILTGEPMDKAGAYAIQGEFKKHIKEYIGSYENIVGFPWELFVKEMGDLYDFKFEFLRKEII